MGDRPQILIADDELGIREALRFLLKDDYELIFAEDGLQALEQMKTGTPKMVLMDVRMPRLDGWEAARRIRSIESQVPIIILTGYPEISDKRKTAEFGIAHYLTKPFDVFLLRDLIRKRFAEHRL